MKTQDRKQSTAQGQDTRQRGNGLDWTGLDVRRRQDSEVPTLDAAMNTKTHPEVPTLDVPMNGEITRFDGGKIEMTKMYPSTISKNEGFSTETRRVTINGRS